MDETKRSIILTPEELAGAERFEQWMDEEDEDKKAWDRFQFFPKQEKKKPIKKPYPEVKKELQLNLF